jgi:23S rRNA-/tRNA-specific pseudouridylate synthase
MDSTFPLGRDVRLLKQDACGLVALEKPPGLLSHPNEKGDESRSLITAGYDPRTECYQWQGGALYLLNRLDSATSGVILCATTEKLAKTIKRQFEQHAIEKTYLALVFGVPRTPRQTWSDRLSIQKGGGRIRTASAGGVPDSETDMRLVKTIPGALTVSLIELRPHTGRSHQLRVQCQRRHLPIVGDANYGDFTKNRAYAKTTGQKRLYLHSHHTAVEYTFSGRHWRFEARSDLTPEWPSV